jgi:glycerol kinase
MNSSPYVLAIDQGTTSTRAILFDASGLARSTAQVELTQLYPRPGWVEHDPEEIWRSVVSTCREAAAAADGPIAAIGVTNQRETTILWERASGRPAHNAIVWQDRRTAELCERWCAEGLEEAVAQRTGLVIDPYFSASKIRWLLDTVSGLRERAQAGEIAFGTIDSFLLWRLSAGAMPPMRPTPRERCCSTSGGTPGTRISSKRSASRARCCPRCWIPVRISAIRHRNCSMRQFRSPGWRAISRRR